MGKPTVTYEHKAEEAIVLGLPAVVWPVDHPSALVSNNAFVCTSPVVQITTNDKEQIVAFETENTIFMRR